MSITEGLLGSGTGLRESVSILSFHLYNYLGKLRPRDLRILVQSPIATKALGCT